MQVAIKLMASIVSDTMNGMKAPMTITPELKQAVDQTGEEPVGVEDPETHVAYLLFREDTYRKLTELAAFDHHDPSLFEVGEFYPDK